jgi:outer membrane immunogenic protein
MSNYLKAMCVAGAMLACGTAQAADPVDPVYDWSGFYAGLHAGYAFGGEDDVGISSTTQGFLGDVGTLHLEGFYGGGQLGYNFQDNYLVYGLEADISAGDVNDSVTGGFGTAVIDTSSSVDVFGTFRGRLGYAMDNILLYGTGGLAWGDVDYDQDGLDAGGQNYSISQNKFELGFALGGGIEVGVTEDVTVGLQYMYVNLGGDTLSAPVLSAGGVPTGEVISTIRTTDFHTVRFNLNFNF